jgi:probable phosphomutase (TIGR03848 family)
MTAFLLIRHATTDYVNQAICGWLPEVHLNAEGQQQAVQLAQRLVHLPIRAIYSSPLERAQATAAPLAERLRLKVKTWDALGEVRFGDWTGRSLQELADDSLWQRFNAFRSRTRIPGGETMLEAQIRMVNALGRLQGAHPDQLIAIVSHAEMIKAAIAYYLGSPVDLFHRLDISPASVSVVYLEDDGTQVICIADTGGIWVDKRYGLAQ